jgi:hypothetical protein
MISDLFSHVKDNSWRFYVQCAFDTSMFSWVFKVLAYSFVYSSNIFQKMSSFHSIATENIKFLGFNLSPLWENKPSDSKPAQANSS